MMDHMDGLFADREYRERWQRVDNPPAREPRRTRATLDEETVSEIRIRMVTEKAFGDDKRLAEEYGVSTHVIASIRAYTSWKSIRPEGAGPEDIARGDETKHSALTPDQVRDIKQRLADDQGWGRYARIARDYEVNPQTISNIDKGRTWAEVTI